MDRNIARMAETFRWDVRLARLQAYRASADTEH
jgi:hypothetical protein